MTAHAQIDHAEARTAVRRSVKLRALIREVGSARIDIDMVDLSTGGFRFQSLYRFPVGARVFVTIPGLAAQEAVVMWHRRDAYGCRFLRPLHAAVFDTLVARFR